MSFKQIVEVLMELGLSETDAKVYIFLVNNSPQKAAEIANILKMQKQRLYPCLRNLQTKGIVNCTNEHPKHFSAVPIKEALSTFINASLRNAQDMEENRKRILSFWRSIMGKNDGLI